MITDGNLANSYSENTETNYNPAGYASRTSDPPPDTPGNNIPENNSIANLDDDDAAIILNPEGVDNHGPITGV